MIAGAWTARTTAKERAVRISMHDGDHKTSSPLRMRKGFRAVAGAAALVLVLSACGEDEDAVSDTVPQAIAEDETLLVAVASDAPPFAVPERVAIYPGAGTPPPEVFYSGGVTGVDVELLEEAADRLGLDVEWQEVAFEDLLAGVENGTYEAAAGGITVTEERAEQVSFVTYLQGGTQWGARRGNPTGVSPADPCGARVAVQRATIFEIQVEELSAACREAGEDEVDVDLVSDLGDAVNRVVRAQSDAFIADQLTVAFYQNLTSGNEPAGNTQSSGIRGIGTAFDILPYGFATADTELASALQSTLQEMIDDGTYEDVLDDWTIPANAEIETSETAG
jgi:polar amino acid transport system substrate-binding protein